VAAAAVALVVAEVLSGKSDTTSARAAPALPTEVLVPPRVALADLRGKPAIVHFWASWCGPCTKEAPELARLPSVLRGRATLVGVDWSDSRSGAAAFVRKHRWTFPVLVDDAGHAGTAWQIRGLPATFVLDARGRIVKRLAGPQTVKGLLADVDDARAS
jgi:cytochrome c biogenesis protein CcmG, thiol:disulfide interchange protein DsbE